ncbi:small ribosomal subunit protein cS23z-like [Populus nigra]|uniref:small ribosomal subunit protein cS23z-like n=1 Tax=Populus nigra TaxID=3691 RepID=UPI002B26CE6F|nr:small ribosomal subunit protein cS23z-like [Populus nigra]
MLSMAFQSGVNNVFTYYSLPSRTPSCKTFKATISVNPKPNPIRSSTFFDRKRRHVSRNQRYTTFAVPEALAAETPADAPPSNAAEESIPIQETEKAELVVKQVEKPRLVLKFVWMEKNIGLALDQVIPGHGTVPLSPYFFWPRKDAWEELKATLESKPWISQKKMIILLNQATDIINLWQQSGGNLTAQ